ncbi:MAG: NAD(+) synthase, partial [Candidatus Methanomethylophilaceae archaeon]|nr:NAD(+) synthase [Candidatus Methanomethylophilaceae archaeon]
MDGIPTVTQDDVDGLVAFIRNTIERTGCKGAVIGLSGGLDSAVVTKLCVDAIGPEKVLNIFMPSRVTVSEDYVITKDLSKLWGTEYRIMDVQPAVDSLQSVLLSQEEAPLDRGNISARCRMIVLYNQA